MSHCVRHDNGRELASPWHPGTEKFRLNMTKQYYVYILTNRSRTFYVGMTNNLERRVYEHKHKMIDGFTKHYNITILVYYEAFANVNQAIAREKQVKDWRREKKIELIESMNPAWADMSAEWGI